MKGACFAVACVALSCAPGKLEPRAQPASLPAQAAEKVAAGYLLTTPPADVTPPNNDQGRPVAPKITGDFRGPPTSNDWWSSLIWQSDAKNPFSRPMYAHPLTLSAKTDGLALGYPTKPDVDARQYMFRHASDVLVGLEGLKAPDARVAGYSDWAVTAVWRTNDGDLRATFGHGLPFVYLERRGKAAARVVPQREGEAHDKRSVDVWHQGGEWLGFSVGDHHYLAVGPTGSEWKTAGDAFVSDLAGKDYFSVAVLPSRDPITVDLFRAHAYAFVTDTKVAWSYDARSATVRTTFAVKTKLQEEGRGHAAEPLLALYRHQWKRTSAALLDKSYVSPRGEMKLMKGASFTTEMRHGGVLPLLPNVAQDDKDDLSFYVKEAYWQAPLFPPGLGDKPQRDAYWDGKSMLRIANLIEIADQIGYTAARDHFLQALKNELEDWFDGHSPCALFYDKKWRTIISSPAGFGSDARLNDHHFHYGYFVFAAAIVARHDPKWAARWHEYVDLLVKDAANWDRADDRFPFLRYMDAYAGHSWANGPAEFDEGNNEESSSEDANFSAAAILWGAATGNAAIRDLGLFLYANQTAAIEEYWWDVDQKVFPQGFGHTAVAMVWGAGGRYDTWWDPNPIYIHGINVMPASGGALYMGRHPDYVLRSFGEVERRNRGEPLTWRDVMWMYLALADADRALVLFDRNGYFTPEFGNSRAMTYHWLANLGALGRIDTTVTADAPTYAVFSKAGKRTHVAFNPGASFLKVTFSDGVTVDVPPRQTAIAGAAGERARGAEAPR